MLDAVRQIDPAVPGLLPDRIGRRREIGIGKCTDRDAAMLGPEVEMPIDRTAAGGTEVEADRASALDVPRVDCFGTVDADL